MPRGSTLERRSRRSQGQPRFVSQPLCARWTHSLPLSLRGEWHCRFRDVDSIKAFAVLLIIPSRVVLSNSFSVAVHKFSSDLPRPLPFAFLALFLSSLLLPSSLFLPLSFSRNSAPTSSKKFKSCEVYNIPESLDSSGSKKVENTTILLSSTHTFPRSLWSSRADPLLFAD